MGKTADQYRKVILNCRSIFEKKGKITVPHGAS
jgi:hypothetical protein